MNVYQKSLSLMNRNEKRSGILLLLLTALKGFSDTVGVASILPFLSVLAQPELVETNPYASLMYEAFGFTSVENFLFALGLLIIFILVVGAVIKIVTVYATNRWVEMREHYLSRRLLHTYVRQPYAYFLTRNTSDMSTAILSMARSVVSGMYRPVLNLFNSVVTLILMIVLLVWTNPFITISSVIVIGTCYLVLYLSLRKFIKQKGVIIVDANQDKFRRVNETLTGIKQVKLSSHENFALGLYSHSSQKLAQARAISTTLSQIPRFGLEVIAFGGIVLLTLILFKQNEGAIEKSLPLIGLYAFAGYRLLPVLQLIYSSIILLRLNAPTVATIYEDARYLNKLPPLPTSTIQPMLMNSSVKFESVSYRYPGVNLSGLRSINLEIRKGTSIGIVGTTGAGKTTLVDVLLGLLEITEGRILVDEKPLNADNIRNWRAGFGYVPQDIFLSDASIAENIAMGIEKSHISTKKIEYAAKASRLYDFITKELPEGFDTLVGERGVRLSGGQRQRLGIARALYNNPQIIVFDEATSALDNTTERELISEISQMSGERTIIMIAHRLTTIENCDQIIVLNKGEVIGRGTYAELSDNNPVFRKMASREE